MDEVSTNNIVFGTARFAEGHMLECDVPKGVIVEFWKKAAAEDASDNEAI